MLRRIVLVLVVAAALAALSVTAYAKVTAKPVVPVSGTAGPTTQVKYIAGGDAYSGADDNGDEAGISGGDDQVWSVMSLPGYGQGSCCPSSVPARTTITVPKGTKAILRVTVSGMTTCDAHDSSPYAACFVRVLANGHQDFTPDTIVFNRAEPTPPTTLNRDSHEAEFVSQALPAGTYTIAVQWSAQDATFVSDQMLIVVQRLVA